MNHVDDTTKNVPEKRRFWQNLFLTKEGTFKSILFLSSFCLSLLFLVIYGVSYIFIVPFLDQIIGSAQAFLVNALESLIPAVFGTAVCNIGWPLFRDKRVFPAAFAWLFVMALVLFIAVMVSLVKSGSGNTELFLHVYLLEAALPILIGNAVAWLRYTKYIHK